MKKLICILSVTLSLATSGATSLREVSSSKLVPLIADALSKSFELDQGQLVLEPSRALSPVSVPKDTVNISIKLTSQLYRYPTAFMKAEYTILADGIPAGKHTSYFKAQLIQEVWIAQKVAIRGKTLGESKLIKKKADIINLRDGVWTGQPDETQQLTTTISAGTVIQERHLRRTPVVFKNHTVEAVLKHKALEIRLRVLALEDGAPGDVIRLRNTSSSKEIRGTIINSREVKIVF